LSPFPYLRRVSTEYTTIRWENPDKADKPDKDSTKGASSEDDEDSGEDQWGDDEDE
jgi:hypothetical protein